MKRTEIIELMARAFDEHYKHLGIGPCEIAYTLANDAVRVLTLSGLAIVPTELDDMVLKPVFDKTHDAGIGSRREELYRAMIAVAMKEQEGRE